MTETKTLKFRRQFAGSYFAQDATREYAIYRDGKTWVLRIRATIETAGVRHALNQPDLHRTDQHDTKNLAVLVANAYSQLGDDYCHGDRGARFIEAIKRGYAAEREGWFSPTERLEAARAGQHPDSMIPGDL